MRAYQLYLIKDEIASHYVGKERMFYQLFKDYNSAEGELKSIISKQIEYLTKPLPVLRIHQLLYQQLSKHTGFRVEQGTYHLRSNKLPSTATLKIVNDRTLLVESDGSLEAETIFFEVLRKSETSFMAVDIDSTRYGWLKPIKERKFV